MRIHHAIACICLPLIAGAGPAAKPRPQRIVSLNVCTDQLLVELADRSQIAGITRNATNADLSAVSSHVAGLRILGSSAEELLEIRPDLVIGMPAKRNAAFAVLQGEDFPALDLKPADSVEDIRQSILQTAAAVGHPERGQRLVDQMGRDLAAIPRNGRGRVAVHYQRRGFVTGSGTLVDELITRSGLVNLATQEGLPALARLDLEEIVAAKPDFLIVESAADRITDQGTEMLHHPALRGIPRISVPQAWTVCGGPAYVEAARSIAAQLAAHDHANVSRGIASIRSSP